MVTFGILQEFRSEEEGIAAYIERVQVFFKANGIEEERQESVLLSVIGGKTYSLLRDLLAPDRPDSKTFTQLAETLMEHFQPKTLVIAEQFYFHSRNQKTTETIGQYVAELRRLATHCEFRDTLSDALRDRLVCRIANRATQRRLLTERNLTLSHAMEIAQGMEAAEENVHKLKATADQDEQPVHRFAPADHPNACYRCGGIYRSRRECMSIQGGDLSQMSKAWTHSASVPFFWRTEEAFVQRLQMEAPRARQVQERNE